MKVSTLFPHPLTLVVEPLAELAMALLSHPRATLEVTGRSGQTQLKICSLTYHKGF
jgi:hypothetical protein